MVCARWRVVNRFQRSWVNLPIAHASLVGNIPSDCGSFHFLRRVTKSWFGSSSACVGLDFFIGSVLVAVFAGAVVCNSIICIYIYIYIVLTFSTETSTNEISRKLPICYIYIYLYINISYIYIYMLYIFIYLCANALNGFHKHGLLWMDFISMDCYEWIS